jgi:serine/threonine protein kinase/streptogramin lyase
MANRIGTEIAGYRIESLIARGGMGEVYLAAQAFPERKVALKLLPQDLASDPDFRERFVRESNAAASLEHPNIVPVYGAGEFEGELWISMRYVEGEDLRRLLDREGRLHSERAAAICAQVADALQEAHRHGVIHRDVTPGNILVSGGDRAYLTDFGLIRRTKLETDMTRTGQFMGTVGYVAPEQIRGDAVDGRADVYSLGCVLCECLMGVPPFPRDAEVATLFAHLQDPPPKPSAKRPELPAAFDSVVAKSMAKLKDDRYNTAGEMAVELERARRERFHPQPSPPRRRRWPAWLVVGVVAALVSLAMGLSLATRGGIPPLATRVWARSVSRIDGDTNRVTKSAHDGHWGWHLIAAEGALWETGPGGLLKRDERTGRAENVIKLGGQPRVVAAGFGAIWVTVEQSASAASLVRVNAATDEVVATVDVSPSRVGGNNALIVATDKTSVWVFNGGGTLWRIDPIRNRINETFQITSTGSFMTTGGGFVWVSNVYRNEVMRVDPATGESNSVILQSEPDQLAYIAGAVWVEDVHAGTVTPIDGSLLEPRAPIGTPNDPAIEIAGLGSLWIAADGVVSRINPLSGEAIQIPITFAASMVAPDDRTGNVWVLRQPNGWAPPGG